MNNKEILVTAFRSLTKRQRSNLKYHLDAKTPILHGDDAHYFIDGDGGG